MPNLVQMIQEIANNATADTMPSGVYYGTVINTNPLEINLEQKMILKATDLVLSTLVQDFEVDMTVEHFTENDAYLNTLHDHPPSAPVNSFDSTHKHAYKGRKTFLIHLGLQPGEKVILLREQGGQRFVVLDRIRGEG